MHYKLYNYIIVHSTFGIAAVLIIIKIILAIAFVGSLTALFHAFAGIKNLLKFKDLPHESEPYFSHDHFHDFHYGHFDEPPPFYKTEAPEEPSFPVALKRTQQSLEGGRLISLVSSRNHKKKRSMENYPTKRLTNILKRK